MRVEILLKDIRKEKRCKFATAFKSNRNITFAFKLYRKEWKRAIFIDSCKDSTSIKYRN